MFRSTMKLWKQVVATLLSLSILWVSGNFAEAAQPTPELPFQLKLAPPASLGTVVDYFASEGVREGESAGTRKPLVILIQDLHAHYGVQKNISGILDFLSKKLDPAFPLSP